MAMALSGRMFDRDRGFATELVPIIRRQPERSTP
jgi:hypothetical protein